MFFSFAKTPPGKEVIVKYCHLRFKGDEDLLSFTSTLIPDPDAGGGPAAKPGAAEKRKSIDTDGSGPNKRERAELARLQAVMETESPKKMAAALQLQADALVKEAVAAQPGQPPGPCGDEPPGWRATRERLSRGHSAPL